MRVVVAVVKHMCHAFGACDGGFAGRCWFRLSQCLLLGRSRRGGVTGSVFARVRFDVVILPILNRQQLNLQFHNFYT